MDRTALLIVDMQNAFFNVSPLKDRKQELTESCNRLIAYASEHEIPVFNIRTLHSKSRATWTLNMFKDGKGMLYGGNTESEPVPGLHTEKCIELSKTRDSAFNQTNLALMLHSLDIHQLIICGVSTHVCIMQTAADAIGSDSPEFDKPVLSILNQKYRQNILSNDEITKLKIF